MKKTILISIIFTISSWITYAQESDTTRITLGNKKILVISEENTELKLGDTTCCETWKYRMEGFKFGINGFLNSSNSLSVPEGYDFLETDVSKSYMVKFTLPELRVNLLKENIYFHLASEVEFNSYEFRKNYWLIESSDNTTEIGAYKALRPDSSVFEFDKNRLKTTFINIPLMFSFHTNKNHEKAFHLGIGGYAGVKVASKMKYKFKDQGDGTKLKIKDDYYLNPFQYGLNASVGYGKVNLFGTYSLNGLFESGKGPKLYPFTIGVMLVGF